MTLVRKMLVLFIQLAVVQYVIAIDPKLDFSEAADLVKRDKASNVKTTNIKGLRITVDTSELGSPESKSSGSDSGSRSSETVENTKNTKIGVRTDITFEISNETNDTKVDDKIDKKVKKEKTDDEDEDGIVPVFKGRPAGAGDKKPGIIALNGHSNEIPIVTSYHGRQHPVEAPVFHPTNDRHNQYGGEDNWSRFLPKTAVWTTERSFRRYDSHQFHNHNKDPEQFYKRPFVPYTINQNKGNNWRPCTCNEYPYIRPLEDPHAQRPEQIDDKLDPPFKKQYK